MKMVKIILSCVIILTFMEGYAQSPDYKKEWQEVTRYLDNNQPSSAKNVLKQIFSSSIKKNNEPQQIKSILYLLTINQELDEDSRKNNYYFLDSQILKSKFPIRNILLSIQAEYLSEYVNNYSYLILGRTSLADKPMGDIETWDIRTFRSKIKAYYMQSIESQESLRIPISNFKSILEEGKNTRNLRPKLYDLLAHRALDYFMQPDNDITEPAEKFIINNPVIFEHAADFISTSFDAKDSTSGYLYALRILQQLCANHINEPEALFDVDIKRIEFGKERGVFENKDSLYETTLLKLQSNSTVIKIAAEAMYMLADFYYEKGNRTAERSQSVKFILKSKSLCDSIIKKYPDTEASQKSQYLISQIKLPEIKNTIEEVNLPNEPFKSLIQYKNISKVYLRIYKYSEDEFKEFIYSGYEKQMEQIFKKMPFLERTVQLPGSEDYSMHAAELMIDPLSSGTYIMILSEDSSFAASDNILERQIFSVSRISYINTENEYYVLDRKTGMPIMNAQVQIYIARYNSSKGNYELKEEEKYSTDKNGRFALRDQKTSRNILLDIQYKQDRLFRIGNGQYQPGLNELEKNENKKSTFLFTDRSIYRPGQQVYFKGIVINQSNDAGKYSVLPNLSTKISLLDANNTEVKSIHITTGEFGSFNGSFQIPEGIMNGEFNITDSSTNGLVRFNVEDYKRPNFEVTLEDPKGSYRVNDSITITGSAKAYSGVVINNAKGTFRVIRNAHYPYWWLNDGGYTMRLPINRGTTEITNGILTTNGKGEFNISFKAFPDEELDKDLNPYFNYEISVDITDINGETRAGKSRVTAGYSALQLIINSATNIKNGPNPDIKVLTSNINGVFEKSKISLSIEKLLAPEKFLRKRYWPDPDQFLISKKEHDNLFPLDPYSNENNPETWKTSAIVLEITDSTKADGSIKIPKAGSIVEGWYKLTAKSTDKYGQSIKAEKIIFIYNKSNLNTGEAASMEVSSETAEPGSTIEYKFATSLNDIFAIRSINKNNVRDSMTYLEFQKGGIYKYQLPITEKNRGQINVGISFIKENRLYSTDRSIVVPWTNKDLRISIESFREKIIPGTATSWKINIAGLQGEKLAIEAMASMYDASLDQSKYHTWGNPIKAIWPASSYPIYWNHSTFNQTQSVNWLTKNIIPFPAIIKIYDQLINPGIFTGGGITIRGAGGFMQARLSAVVEDKSNVVNEANAYSNEMENGGIIATSKNSEVEKTKRTEEPPQVSMRKNFNETAFFFPELRTDSSGNISFNFTMPEALTRWKFMLLAHSKELASEYLEKNIITQKPLMITPNPPRFLREGDHIEFPVKISNLEKTELTGKITLELFDASTGNSIDGWFKNIFPLQYFTVEGEQSNTISFPMDIPFTFTGVLGYRIKAVTTDNLFGDGEERYLPVLSNRILITESVPLFIQGGTKSYKLDKLINLSSNTSITHQGITVECTSNPAWYVVQSLPYLMELPNECSEQRFNRYYANTLASFIARSNPKIKAVFDEWRTKDSSALLSNLQKNEELKQLLLQETPWVIEASREQEEKIKIAYLFDSARVSNEKKSTIQQLAKTQYPNGGFSWFEGGPDDRYITQNILCGIGHLDKLGALNEMDKQLLEPIYSAALMYADNAIMEEFDQLIKWKVNLSNNNLSAFAIQYLYMRSFFRNTPLPQRSIKAVNYFRSQAEKYWMKHHKYLEAMIALALQRNKKGSEAAKMIIRSLKESAIYKVETGMYWKEFNNPGYYWQDAPIECQALIIEAFNEVEGNKKTIDNLKTWLLANKRTNHWKSTKATAEACYALLIGGNNWLNPEKQIDIQLGERRISSKSPQSGTGYVKEFIPGNDVTPDMGNIKLNVSLKDDTVAAPSWGAIYWQYFEDADKVTSSATSLQLKKSLFIVQNTSSGPVLVGLNNGDEIHIGDKIKVRIEIRSDLNLEYIHMKDMRGACMEPKNILSEYKYQGGLGYYESTRDASTQFFFPSIPRGTYIFEYEMFAAQAGEFSNGITSIQCMYAPEFNSHSEGITVIVNP